MAQQRATGANAYFAAAFETAYGAGETGAAFYNFSAYRFTVSGEQELINDPLLGAGRDPLAPQKGAFDVTGQIDVPVDARRLGVWLRGLLGPAESEAAIGSRGHIAFTGEPADGDTVTLGGVVWTFRSTSPGANETELQGSLEATLDQLASDLNGSADGTLSAATYSRLGDRLEIRHDTADATGDTFALATDVAGAKVSAATLTGGGLIEHVWHSGAATLPSLVTQVEHRDLEAGSNRFTVARGVAVNTMAIARERTGSARAVLDVIGQDEKEASASVAGTPTALDVDIFGQFQGVLLVDGRKVANITGGNLSYSNNLDVVEDISSGAIIAGADPGEVAIRLELTARYSHNALKAAADAASVLDVRYGFYDPATGREFLIQLHELHLPRPRKEVDGPGGISVTYAATGAQSVPLGRSATMTLINDVASYEP